MTVWVDDAFIEATVTNGPVSHTSRWCHLIADDLAELHDFARALGLKRAYFQDHPNHPHYDLTEGKRRQAVRLGAEEITWREAPALLQRFTSDPDQKRPFQHAGEAAPEFMPGPGRWATADDLDGLAGEAWRAGAPGRALGLIGLARMAFPEQAARWDGREARVVRAGLDRRDREATS